MQLINATLTSSTNPKCVNSFRVWARQTSLQGWEKKKTIKRNFIGNMHKQEFPSLPSCGIVRIHDWVFEGHGTEHLADRLHPLNVLGQNIHVLGLWHMRDWCSVGCCIHSCVLWECVKEREKDFSLWLGPCPWVASSSCAGVHSLGECVRKEWLTQHAPLSDVTHRRPSCSTSHTVFIWWLTEIKYSLNPNPLQFSSRGLLLVALKYHSVDWVEFTTVVLTVIKENKHCINAAC